MKFAECERELFGRLGDPERVERLSGRYSALVFDAVMRAPFVEGAYPLLTAAKGRIDVHVVSETPEEELRCN